MSKIKEFLSDCYQNKILYLTTLLFSLLGHSFVILLNNANYGTFFFTEQGSLAQIFLITLSSVTMAFCLLHLQSIDIRSQSSILIISLLYSLSSYSFIQSKSVESTIVFVLLPILFYSLEQMIQNNKSFAFLIMASICFCFDAITTASIIICMLFAVILYIHSDSYNTLTSCIHYIVVSVSALLLSGVASFPQLANYYFQFKNESYSGFQINYPLSVFLSRFYPGAISSTVFDNAHGLNIYFGLFAILILISFFFNNGIPAKRRWKALFLTIIYIGIMQISPMQYLTELCQNAAPIYLFYDFYFIFFFLLLTYEGFSKTSKLSSKAKVITICLYFILTFLIFAGSAHNIHPMAQTTIIVFSAFYILFLIFSNKLSLRSNKYLLLLILTELIGNSICISFQEYVPKTALCKNDFSVVSSVFVKRDNTPIAENVIQDALQDEYLDFCQDHIDKELSKTLSGIEELADIVFNYQVDPLFAGSYFERYNEICRALNLDGDLFIQSSDATISFDPCDNYMITSQGHNIYYITSKSESANDSSQIATYDCINEQNDFYILFDLYDTPFHFTEADKNDKGYISLPLSSEYGVNFKVDTYTLNQTVYQQIVDLLNTYEKEHANNLIPMSVYYAAIIATCLSILMILIFTINKDKDRAIKSLLNVKDKFNHLFVSKIRVFLIKNKLYFLSFFIPMIILLLCAIIYDLQPFGTNSIWDGDGLLSVLPFTLDNARNISNGNWYMSFNGGYGYSILPISPIYLITSFIPQAVLPCFYQYVIFIAIAFSSFSMFYYLTHRIFGIIAQSNDCKAIIPGLFYSLNSYMLFMSGYIGWFFVIPLLPILVLALERLIYKKKWFLYVCLLSYIMYCDIPISFFVCIALCFIFLFYENFSSVKDFVKKGLTFASFSILAAINAIAVLSSMFISRQTSGYQAQDKQFPNFMIFGSFWKQWKQHMIFSTTNVVTGDNNSIILYASILCILLFFLFIFTTRFTIKEKIRRLIPVIFLYFSFNERIMSYIISGFHYQSNVPNRHVFVLCFFLGILSFEVLVSLEKASFKTILVGGGISFVFVTLCQIFSNENSTMSFYTTLALIILYIILITAMKKQKKLAPIFSQILVLILSTELFANSIYIFRNISSEAISAIGDYTSMQEYINTKLDTSNKVFRICFPNNQLVNSGLIFDAPSTDFFVPNISEASMSFNKILGGINGNNFVHSTYGNSVVTNSIFGVKYLAVPYFALTSICNLGEYHYIGYFNNFYFFENPKVLSPAYYAPDDIVNLQNTIYSPLFINNFVQTYLPDSEDIFNIVYLTNTQSDEIECNPENYYEYQTLSGEALNTNEALNLLEDLPDSSLLNDSFKTTIHVTPETDGKSYLYTNEYIPLGNLSGETTYDFNLSGTRMVEPNYHMLCTINDDTYQKYMNYMEDKQLHDLRYEKYSITGTSNYEEEGYTLFCIPYSSTWKAYIDGVETEVISPNNSYMLVKTPCGKHTVKLVYDRTDTFYRFAFISMISWTITILSAIISGIIKKRNRAS